MGFSRFNAHLATGTATGVGVAGQVNGNALFLGRYLEKEAIAALVTVDAETDTLTLSSKWQVSNDASTWFDLAHDTQNPAAVALATGTGGADASVTKTVAPHPCVYGYKFARASLVVGGDTGTANDTYSVAYNYRQLDKGEARDSHLRFNVLLTTGTATGVAPGSQVNGTALFIGGMHRKVDHLSALVTVDGETNTITLTGKWQGSNDGSTWFDVAHASHNPAGIALVTGTAGADAAVTRVLPAPAGVYSYKYARAAIAVGVVTGTSNDTYSMSYCFRQNDAGSQNW